MKIKRIDVFQADLTYSSDKYLLSGGRSYRSFDATVARLETDDGFIGWGESTPTMHLGQTVPEKFLRCVFDCRDMLESNISIADIPVVDGHVTAPTQPGRTRSAHPCCELQLKRIARKTA